MRVRVAATARLHFGFQNLSPSRERLYGGLGVAVDAPEAIVAAEPAEAVVCDADGDVGAKTADTVAVYARRATELLGVEGARVTVESALPRHVGFGSGTQLALCTFTAIARAYGREPAVRDAAADLGRGGRSGVGVAAFEAGGFVVDAGTPTDPHTETALAEGVATVPSVAVQQEIPADWRFLLVVPDADAGRSGATEDASMQSVIGGADPTLADRIEAAVAGRVLPAVADGDAARFGAAIQTVDRLNGEWYTDEQGDIYRAPVAEVVDALTDSRAVFGVGQSSWGPAVYGVTTAGRAEAARDAGQRALSHAGLDGEVAVVAGRNRGAVVTQC
ncbi:beta-ribofuranosylaminobenzene 5'-phosphate synthase family protein [Halobellus clavatus]|jgi:beta-ribofuranosylaminobenzene 5'-phosphate synthase|uniref:Beta-ribofuranosylaminobenzene 5'-phosphate synthase n=1 Tax=Halobellus clavatus TaxID=660517 RepID=A0A1H3FKW8_9EURY|nr:beta-ribofuranosylaminobenzene 5'-phosphate synthase family protein [Halobellus clavatus]SDX91570.1 beta-ribofuranosylaminobenzene 5'-phosphate synthase [Halobellus clavatus]